MGKKRREPDSPGNAVQLGQRETVAADQQIRADDGRERSRERACALVRDEARGLAAVEQRRDPGRPQLAVAEDFPVGGGSEVKPFERAVERERGGADGVQLGTELRRERPRVGRKPPRLSREKRLRGERVLQFRKIHCGEDSLFPPKLNFSLPRVPAGRFIFRQ